MKRNNCFACCATFKPSGDAVSEVSLGQFSLHPSADSAKPFGRVAQYTGWTPLNCTYRREFRQRAARHLATSPDFIILCNVSSQHVCHADWINLWSLPSREAPPTMSLCRWLPMCASTLRSQWSQYCTHLMKLWDGRLWPSSLITEMALNDGA